MFVRWQTYRSQARDRLRAVLVESVRVDGKPRQKHIAFLGSVASEGERQRFWYSVTKAVSRIQLSPRERDRIAAAVARKVPGRLLTKPEVDEWERRWGAAA